MTLQESIIQCMNTARNLERGQLYPEGAENDFKHHLKEYAQELIDALNMVQYDIRTHGKVLQDTENQVNKVLKTTSLKELRPAQ